MLLESWSIHSLPSLFSRLHLYLSLLYTSTVDLRVLTYSVIHFFHVRLLNRCFLCPSYLRLSLTLTFVDVDTLPDRVSTPCPDGSQSGIHLHRPVV